MRKFTAKEVTAQVNIIASATAKPSDGVALHLRLHMESGKFDEAWQAVQSVLESGTASPDMQRLAADMMRQVPKRRKRAPSAAPKDWREIGLAVEKLCNEGLSHQEAVEEYAQQEGVGKTKVDQALGFYLQAKGILV
jgi:hypothetical protein